VIFKTNKQHYYINMGDINFKYCKGIGCPIRERCVHYLEGLQLQEGDWTWMYDCGGEYQDFMPTI
jgi:hypothetical protein